MEEEQERYVRRRDLEKHLKSKLKKHTAIEEEVFGEPTKKSCFRMELRFPVVFDISPEPNTPKKEVIQQMESAMMQTLKRLIEES